MKRIIPVLCLLFLHTIVNAQQKNIQRPKLVVGIVVDQMRWDYLYRYYDRYGEGGLKRMMNNGFNCQNAMINYLPSFTAPGHATIYTGSIPAIHGISANDWLDYTTGKMTYCTGDSAVAPIDGSAKAGKMSPRNMQANTITDELKIATQQRAKVFGIGLKDRGSILPAGHAANGAFWFDDSTGNFMTSSYYVNELPNWLSKFNSKRWADTLMAQEWNLLYPLSSYINSTPDNMPSVEGLLKGETQPVFPHRAAGDKGYNGLRFTPGGNTITFKAAKACIKGEQLGADNITDFLCVTFSTTDYAGHNYGPDAVEMEDMYLRFDLELAAFLSYLDKNVGEGSYTVFLTADHGAAHNAEYMRSLKIPAGSETQAQATARMNEYLRVMTGKDSLVLTLYNYQVFLNQDALQQKGVDKHLVKQHIATWLKMQDGVAFVIDLEHLADAVVPEPIRTMVVNGYHPERSGSIQIIMKPGWYSGYSKTGTTHGTWNPYDTHIPLLWYGSGVAKGATYETVYMTDIAPTIAALLHIQMPNGCVGRVITAVIK